MIKTIVKSPYHAKVIILVVLIALGGLHAYVGWVGGVSGRQPLSGPYTASYEAMIDELSNISRRPSKANPDVTSVVEGYIAQGDNLELVLSGLEQQGFKINEVKDPNHFDADKHDSSHIADYKVMRGIFSSNMVRIIIGAKSNKVENVRSFIRTSTP